MRQTQIGQSSQHVLDRDASLRSERQELPLNGHGYRISSAQAECRDSFAGVAAN
jgi:hypothetical protein